jgi:signal peptidase
MVSIRRRLGQFDRRRVANRFALAVLAVIIFLFVAGAVPQLVGADNSYVVQSDSMSPAIDAGDVVFVYDTAPDYIAKGDVITFEQAGAGDSSRVTHRVVDVVEEDGERRFRTKGDANEDPDPSLVSPSEVIGVVQFHIPYMGYVTSFAQTRLGILALVVVPAVLLVVSEVWDLLSATKPTEEGEEKSPPRGDDGP